MVLINIFVVIFNDKLSLRDISQLCLSAEPTPPGLLMLLIKHEADGDTFSTAPWHPVQESRPTSGSHDLLDELTL